MYFTSTKEPFLYRPSNPPENVNLKLQKNNAQESKLGN